MTDIPDPRTRSGATGKAPATYGPDDRIDDMPLRTGTKNRLRDEGVTTAADARAMTQRQLLQIAGFGPRCLEDLRGCVPAAGLGIPRDGPEAAGDRTGPVADTCHVLLGGRLTPTQAGTLSQVLATVGPCRSHWNWIEAVIGASKAGEWLVARVPAVRDIEPLLMLAAGMGMRFAVRRVHDDGRRTIDHLDERSRTGRAQWECDTDWEPAIKMGALARMHAEGRIDQVLEGMRLARDAPDAAIMIGEGAGR